jgi:hypothetical protein
LELVELRKNILGMHHLFQKEIRTAFTKLAASAFFAEAYKYWICRRSEACSLERAPSLKIGCSKQNAYS